jgi:hypothetical protein
MTRQLVFVHGRAQEDKDAAALKAEWLEALAEGLEKCGLTMPIAEDAVRFPYYGDTLHDMVDGKSADEAAAIIVRGDTGDMEEERFTRAIMREMQAKSGITDAQLAAVAGRDVVERGPLNREWFQGFLRAVDRYVPYGSGSSIALFTHDVYQYLKNSVIRERIDAGISAALVKDVETVVVAHSLGTVVAYNLLRQQGQLRGWHCVSFITLGSPLAIGEIRKTLRGLAPIRCPACVRQWFNAMDERDVVALYPLDTTHFPLDPAAPAIENRQDVRNKTSNRHGIAGYLDDREVARRIYDALTATS